MEAPTRDVRSRRWIGRLIRLGLIAFAVVLAGTWIAHRVPHGTVVRSRDGRAGNIGGISGVQGAVTDAALAAGDLRIYNRDSTVDLILKGNQILAGLSPQTVTKIKTEMERSSGKDTSGLGGFIASTVKQTVANTIGTHVTYPLSDIRELRFEDGQLIAERYNGRETRLFGDTKVNGREQGKTFDERDAQRFIEAVRERKRELGQP